MIPDDDMLDWLTRNATLSADTVVLDMRMAGTHTNAEITRAGIRRAIEALAANDVIRIPDPPTNDDYVFVMDPPFVPFWGPERRPVINKFHDDGDTPVARSENGLCECDRPDQLDNPHRHDIDVACVYWMAGRPSQQDRTDAMRQLNIEQVAVQG